MSFSHTNSKELISYFHRICKWAKIHISKHSSGVHLVFIPSYSLTFKPWKDYKKEVAEEPVAKRPKFCSNEAATQTEFNSDLDCGNLCADGDSEVIEKRGSNDIEIQVDKFYILNV